MRVRSDFLAVLLILLSTACTPQFQGAGTHSNPEIETYDFGEAYIKNSCAYGFDDGDEISATLSAWQGRPSHFGKLFDPDRLTLVGRASSAAISRWMKEDGVVPFAMRMRYQGACAPLAPLPSATDTMEEYWDQFGGSGTLAMYLPLNRAKLLGERTPVVLLREDTDRYSLIHEYLHHVFNTLREQQGARDEDFMERLGTRSYEFEQVPPLSEADESKPEKVRRYLEAWTNYYDVLREAVVIFPLEEMAIESLMQEAAKQKVLFPVTEYNRVNSVAYIRRSYDQSALEILEQIQSLGSAYLELAKRHSLTGLHDRIQVLVNQAKDLIIEGNQLRKAYGQVPNQWNFFIRQSGVIDPEIDVHHGPGCSHEETWKRIRKQLDP